MLDDRGYQPQYLAGTSAGAITAALIAAGYSASEFKDIIFALHFRQFEDRSSSLDSPASANGHRVLRRGRLQGRRFLKWMRKGLEDEGEDTFGDLTTERTDAKYSLRLQVIASDISARQLLVLPRDAQLLGNEPDQLEVAYAVRMSMSIPIFFEPVQVENTQTDHEHVSSTAGCFRTSRSGSSTATPR